MTLGQKPHFQRKMQRGSTVSHADGKNRVFEVKNQRGSTFAKVTLLTPFKGGHPLPRKPKEVHQNPKGVKKWAFPRVRAQRGR